MQPVIVQLNKLAYQTETCYAFQSIHKKRCLPEFLSGSKMTFAIVQSNTVLTFWWVTGSLQPTIRAYSMQLRI